MLDKTCRLIAHRHTPLALIAATIALGAAMPLAVMAQAAGGDTFEAGSAVAAVVNGSEGARREGPGAVL
jgi:hypothetical protein